MATGVFGVDGQYDFMRATFTDGSNVPRMPPMRVGGGTYWRNDSWFVRMGLLHAFGQSDLGVNDTPTAGYNLLKMEISNKQYWQNSPWGATELTTGLVGDNLLGVDVRNSVQFHKDEILMPGRSIKFFVNAKFDGVPPPNKPAFDYSNAPLRIPPIFKAPVLTAWSWVGPYIGANIGYSFGKSRTDAVFSDFTTGVPLLAAASSDNLNGGVGGIQGGYNWQWGNWVGGIEADARISGQGATPSYVCPGAVCNPAIAEFDAPVTATFDQGHRLNSFGTLRGRFGTTITPEVMAYVTGGLAVGSIRSTVRLSGTGFDADGNPGAVSNSFSVLTQKAGWTAGAGLEGRLFGNVTGKVESLYTDFGTISASITEFIQRDADHIVEQCAHHRQHQIHASGSTISSSRRWRCTPHRPAPARRRCTRHRRPTRRRSAPAWTWAGFYVGGTIGYGWGDSNTDTAFGDPGSGAQLFATSASRKLDGAVGVAQGGFNWLVGEGGRRSGNRPGLLQVQRARMKTVLPRRNVAIPVSSASCRISSVQAVSEQGQKLEWFATLRGRLGATVTPGAAAYVTGGLAVGEVMTAGTVFEFDGDGDQVSTIVSSHNTKAGWTAGGGIESRLIGNWTGKLEYLYLDLGSITTVPAPATNSTMAVAFNSRVTANIVRLGVNYKFDPNDVWPGF